MGRITIIPPPGAGGGGSGLVFKRFGPVTVTYDNADFYTTGVPLFTPDVGDLVVGTWGVLVEGWESEGTVGSVRVTTQTLIDGAGGGDPASAPAFIYGIVPLTTGWGGYFGGSATDPDLTALNFGGAVATAPGQALLALMYGDDGATKTAGRIDFFVIAVTAQVPA